MATERALEMEECRTETVDPREIEGACLALLVFDETGLIVHALPSSGPIRLGRQGDVDIAISHPWISRHHATIHLDPPMRIQDLASSNGVFVGGRRLTCNESVALDLGDIVQLGRTMLLLQRLPAGRAPGAALPMTPPVLGANMAQVSHIVERVAGSTLSVLLLGETGVGKERLAEQLHQLSPRRERLFLRLNCAALAETLLESELFGHERGAFTGAVTAKAGLLEVAGGGTVFLDEVGELPPPLQAKLLRVLEERQVLRLGGLKPRPVDVRFVSATNRDLEKEAEAGRFRPDLYYRLDGIAIRVPPLRERRSEIRGLAQTFLGEARKAAGLANVAIAPEALSHLQSYAWPGNVRELKNVMERAALLCPGWTVTIEHLQIGEPRSALAGQVMPAAAAVARPLQDDLAAVERGRIREALARSGGNQSQAAKLLGISRNTLMAKMTHYDFPRPRKR